MPEGSAVKKMRRVALQFLLNTCLNLSLSFKFYSTTSTRQNIRPHKAYEKTELKELITEAQEDTEMFAMVNLLSDMAARIQDLVGLTFGTILKAKQQPDGTREVELPAKKASSRSVIISAPTHSAVEAFCKERKAGDDEVMFPAGDGINPANKWVKKVAKFYKRRGYTVRTHDFRVTTATQLYEETKDIDAVQKYLAHQSITTTQRYVKTSKESMQANVR